MPKPTFSQNITPIAGCKWKKRNSNGKTTKQSFCMNRSYRLKSLVCRKLSYFSRRNCADWLADDSLRMLVEHGALSLKIRGIAVEDQLFRELVCFDAKQRHLHVLLDWIDYSRNVVVFTPPCGVRGDHVFWMPPSWIKAAMNFTL